MADTETIEKHYYTEGSRDNSALWAALMSKGNESNNALETMAMMNNGGFGGGAWNNPLMYIMYMWLFRYMNGNGLAHGFGVVVAVGQALVDGDAQVHRGPHLKVAVGEKHGPVLDFPDEANHGAGAPVGQMVIAALHLDGAQVGDDHGRIVGIRGNHILGHPAMLVQEHDEPDGGLGHEPGNLVENVHGPGGAVHLIGPAGADLAEDVIMDGVQGILGLGMDEGQRLRPLVRKELLDHEGGGDLVALIEIAVGDEPVHLGPKGDGLEQRRHNQLEQVILILRIVRVLFLQVGVDVG